MLSVSNITECVYNSSYTTNEQSTNRVRTITRPRLTKLEKVGQRRIEKLTTEYKNFGYFVINHPYNQTGIDMIIVATPSGKIVEVLEVTSYANKWEYINSSKFNRYVATLNEFNCFSEAQKTLVVSYWENLSDKQIQTLKENAINIRIIGYQD